VLVVVKQVHHRRHQHNAASNPQKTYEGADNQTKGQYRKNQHVGRAPIPSGKKKDRTRVILMRVRANSNLLLARAGELVNILEHPADGFWASKRN
jgi:FtsZ-interacting cell division protein ZipA